MLHHENSKTLFKLCRRSLPVDNRAPGADSFPKNQYWKTCSSWQHCKVPRVKIEQENNSAEFGKDGLDSAFLKELLLFLHPSGSCCCLGKGSRWSLLHLIYLFFLPQILLAKLFVCVQKITPKLYSQQFGKVFTMHNNKSWTFISHGGCYLLCQLCDGYSVFTFILFSSPNPIILLIK